MNIIWLHIMQMTNRVRPSWVVNVVKLPVSAIQQDPQS